jgi:NAD(P)-dependent dehydrogenase (short-subunit alcohol dehydrogenase family)
MGQVEGKVAIVTGGASGIGAACAATLAREGAKVVITDIDDAGAQAVVGQIIAAGGEAICLHQDVSIEEEWPRVIEATERRFGPLNVMMANAGIGILCKAIEMSLADWRRQTAVNLDGVFLSVKYAVPAMRRLDHHHVLGCRSSRLGRFGLIAPIAPDVENRPIDVDSRRNRGNRRSSKFPF